MTKRTVLPLGGAKRPELHRSNRLRLIRLKPQTFPKGQGREKHRSVFAQPGPQLRVPAVRTRPIGAWQPGCCGRLGGAARAGADGGPAFAAGTRRPEQGAPPPSPPWAQGRFCWPCLPGSPFCRYRARLGGYRHKVKVLPGHDWGVRAPGTIAAHPGACLTAPKCC